MNKIAVSMSIFVCFLQIPYQKINAGEFLRDKMIFKRHISTPMSGIGTLRLERSSLEQALKKGFRLVDTAKAYENEEIIGEVLKAFDKKLITVITKLFRPNCQNKETLRNAVLDSIQKIGKVPELFLIHGPYPDVPMLSLVKELELLKKEGHVKEWGVSNFEIEHLEILITHGFLPALNQVEYHPFFQRQKLLAFCKQHGIILQAYRPIAQGKALESMIIKAIASHQNVSASTVIYSWLAQQEISIITKVSSNEHQNEYANSEQVNLSLEQMNAITTLNLPDGKGRTCTKGGWYVPFTKEIASVWRTYN